MTLSTQSAVAGKGHLELSEREIRDGALSPANRAIAEMLLACRGYVVLRGALPPEVLTSIRDAFDVVYEECTRGDDAAGGSKIWPPRVAPESRAQYHCTNGRWRIQPRLKGPLASPELLANPLILSLLRARLGRDFHCRYVSSDTCAPGSKMQAPHSDIALPRHAGASPRGYVMNVPLVECGLHNGPLEVWPGGSHLWARAVFRKHGLDDVLVQDEDNLDVERFANQITSERVTISPGDVLLRDPAMWHRGTPNLSDSARTMLTVGYFRNDYYYIFGESSYDAEAFASMAPEVRRLFAYRFDLATSLFWKARRNPWPGTTRLSLREAGVAWRRDRLERLQRLAADTRRVLGVATRIRRERVMSPASTITSAMPPSDGAIS